MLRAYGVLFSQNNRNTGSNKGQRNIHSNRFTSFSPAPEEV